MITTEEIQGMLGNGGGTVVGQDGDKLGKVGQVYLDDESGKPEWVTVNGGMFGGGESFVPLAQASLDGEQITVPFDKAKVKDAPQMKGSEERLSKDQEAELYDYYGMTPSSPSQPPAGTDKPQVGEDTSGPTTDEAMTRSEEQLKVGTVKVETGKARLRKFVVTENVTTTVPVSHEEVRIEREPITEANRDKAMAGGDITSEEHEVTLHAERPKVTKETVPVERVRMATDTVTDQKQVTEQVRKEQIESDTSDVDPTRNEASNSTTDKRAELG